jgi:hypothetical protein
MLDEPVIARGEQLVRWNAFNLVGNAGQTSSEKLIEFSRGE